MKNVLLCATIFAAGTLAAELPVREVILYKNGIGYFVRSGDILAGDAVRLQFKAGEMNDVLKSLVVSEEGGGKISGLHYDASEPLEARLAQFPFKLGDHQSLHALLDQLKGARVELKTGPETISGAIVSGREVVDGEKQPRHEEAILLLDSGELRTVDLGGVTAMRFSDPVLQGQLVKYLAAVATGRSQEKRSVTVDSTGERARRLTASYVVPAPVWKSSYRLAFTEATEPMLEGWAIVDNTTGEDWTKVRLALVSGRRCRSSPISTSRGWWRGRRPNCREKRQRRRSCMRAGCSQPTGRNPCRRRWSLRAWVVCTRSRRQSRWPKWRKCVTAPTSSTPLRRASAR